jgi:hypothetical protein
VLEAQDLAGVPVDPGFADHVLRIDDLRFEVAVVHFYFADRVTFGRKVCDDLFERFAGRRLCGFGVGGRGQGEAEEAGGEKAGRSEAHG